jgi:hypothetical protein
MSNDRPKRDSMSIEEATVSFSMKSGQALHADSMNIHRILMHTIPHHEA